MQELHVDKSKVVKPLIILQNSVGMPLLQLTLIAFLPILDQQLQVMLELIIVSKSNFFSKNLKNSSKTNLIYTEKLE